MIGCFYAVLLMCFSLAITRLRQNHGLDNSLVTIWLILPPFCYSAVALWAIVNMDVDAVDELNDMDDYIRKEILGPFK